MNGQDLHRLILDKWGHSYDLQLRRSQGRIWMKVMWRYLEQRSFTVSETEYFEHLDTFATHLNEWGATEQVKDFILSTKSRPRLGKAVSVLLELNLGARSLEWMLEES